MTAVIAIAISLLLATTFVGLRIRSGGGWAALRAAWTGEPHCPACRVGMVELEGRLFPQRPYRVWVCLRCTNAFTVPRAADTDAPECGGCRQRSLLVPVWRLPANAEGEPQVQVHESCPVCGHHAIEHLPEAQREPPLAVVIPFPKPRQASE